MDNIVGLKAKKKKKKFGHVTQDQELWNPSWLVLACTFWKAIWHEKCYIYRRGRFWDSRIWERILKIQSILITHRFCICEFSYLLKSIYNFIDSCSAFVVICRHTEWWKLYFGIHIFPERANKAGLYLLVSASSGDDQRIERAGAVQCKKLSSGATWRGFESQCWHLLLAWPQANGLPLLDLIFSFVKWKIKSTKMSCFCI